VPAAEDALADDVSASDSYEFEATSCSTACGSHVSKSNSFADSGIVDAVLGGSLGRSVDHSGRALDGNQLRARATFLVSGSLVGARRRVEPLADIAETVEGVVMAERVRLAVAALPEEERVTIRFASLRDRMSRSATRSTEADMLSSTRPSSTGSDH
jgi:hypothetical protein